MIADYLRVGRLYLVLLAVFTAARFAQSAMGVPYDKAHHVFSIVTLTVLASAFFAAFCRRWRGYSGLQAMGLGLFFGLIAQVVVFIATVLSYAAGAETFFTHPRALNVPAAISLNEALLVRARGLVFGPIADALAAGLGWVLGSLLPVTAVRADVESAPAAAAVRTA
jgi:hypothetical protein